MLVPAPSPVFSPSSLVSTLHRLVFLLFIVWSPSSFWSLWGPWPLAPANANANANADANANANAGSDSDSALDPRPLEYPDSEYYEHCAYPV